MNEGGRDAEAKCLPASAASGLSLPCFASSCAACSDSSCTLLTSIGVLLLLLAVGFAGLLWLTVPSRNQSASIPGLSAPVDISFDARGIPRIRAATLVDAAAALGYVHARDRMFQLDLMRRAASGRLSEIAGPGTLPIDKEMRVLGLRGRAIADYAALPQDVRSTLRGTAPA